jgi:hypothetical protein
MKLLTHNFLACNVKGVKNGYPLIIEAEKIEVREFDMDPGLISHPLDLLGAFVLLAVEPSVEPVCCPSPSSEHN